MPSSRNSAFKLSVVFYLCVFAALALTTVIIPALPGVSSHAEDRLGFIAVPIIAVVTIIGAIVLGLRFRRERSDRSSE